MYIGPEGVGGIPGSIPGGFGQNNRSNPDDGVNFDEIFNQVTEALKDVPPQEKTTGNNNSNLI